MTSSRTLTRGTSPYFHWSPWATKRFQLRWVWNFEEISENIPSSKFHTWQYRCCASRAANAFVLAALPQRILSWRFCRNIYTDKIMCTPTRTTKTFRNFLRTFPEFSLNFPSFFAGRTHLYRKKKRHSRGNWQRRKSRNWTLDRLDFPC